MARQRGIKSDVYLALQAYPGLSQSTRDMAETLGYTVDQVRSACWSLSSDSATGVVKVMEHIYSYVPPKNNGKGHRLFEEIGKNKNGLLVLQDEEGNLYKAEEL